MKQIISNHRYTISLATVVIVLAVLLFLRLNANPDTTTEIIYSDDSSGGLAENVRSVLNEQRIINIESNLKTINQNIINLANAINNINTPGTSSVTKNDLAAIVNNINALEEHIKDMRTAIYRSNYLNINVENILVDVEFIRNWMVVTDNITADIIKKLDAHTANTTIHQ